LIRQVREVDAAGFHGFHASHSPGLERALAQAPQLRFWGQCDLAKQQEIKPRLEMLKSVGAKSVLVQLGDHDTSLRRALELAKRLFDAAGQLKLEVTIETHRDTCTETPE
jgi:hypothetical protein